MELKINVDNCELNLLKSKKGHSKVKSSKKKTDIINTHCHNRMGR